MSADGMFVMHFRPQKKERKKLKVFAFSSICWMATKSCPSVNRKPEQNTLRLASTGSYRSAPCRKRLAQLISLLRVCCTGSG